jgi:hypothetical protein
MKKLVLLALAGGVLASCSKDDSENEASSYQVPVEVNSNKTDLEDRIAYFDEPINLSGKRGAQSVTLTKKAEISSILLDGYKLSATGVDSRNSSGYARTFLSFHTRGEEYGGELLVLDHSDPNQPIILQSLVDHDADYNDITIGQNYVRVWIAGDRSVDASGYSNTNGAVASKYWLNGNKNFDANPKWEEAPILGYSGNSMTRVPNAGTACSSKAETWITSGSNGEVRVLKACDVDGNAPLHQRIVDNAKHFDFDPNSKTGVLLRGLTDSTCAIDVYDLTSRYNFTTYTLPYDVTYLGKNGVKVEGDYVYLALGDDGVVKVDATNGNVLNTFEYSGGDGYANAVATSSANLYIANGSDGLIVIDKNNFTFKGRYDGGGSCNFVDAINGYVYLANGDTGGFILLKED